MHYIYDIAHISSVSYIFITCTLVSLLGTLVNVHITNIRMGWGGGGVIIVTFN